MDPDNEELSKPKVSEELVKSLVLRLYGLKVIFMKRMSGQDDQTFHVKVSDQHQNPYIQEVLQDGYTLKITNTFKSILKGHFDSMHSMFFHLKEKGLRVPSPIKNLNGSTWALEKMPLLNAEEDVQPGEQLFGVHLLSFLPGVQISNVPYTSELLFQWGILLANLHIATKTFIDPNLFSKDFFWKLERVPDLKKYIVGLNDEKTKLLLRVLEKYPEEITKNIEELPKGVIHGDFNHTNVLVQITENELEEKQHKVDGILDFGDMYYGTYVWDIGLVMSFVFQECKTMDPLDAAGHALAGYLSLRKLSDLESSLLKICMEICLCHSLVIFIYKRNMDPNDSDPLEPELWAKLEHLLLTSNNDLLYRFKKIEENYFS